MAIVILSKSICKICGKVLTSADEIILMPAYFGDPNDPFYFFHDERFHESCFLNHPLHQSVLESIEWIERPDRK